MKKTRSSKLVIDNEIIDFSFFDRKSDTTLFCIHGVNSSKTFIGKLDKNETKYNIFSYSYGDLKSLKIDNVVALTKRLIATFFPNQKLIIVSHSFGSYVATKLFDNENIIKYIFINPMHPLTFGYRPFERTLTVAKNNQNLILKNQERLKDPKQNGNSHTLRGAIDKRAKWTHFLCEIKDRSTSLKAELMQIINHKDKSIFICSARDFIISSRLLENFLRQNKIIPKVVNYTGHSPLNWQTKSTYLLFEFDH